MYDKAAASRVHRRQLRGAIVNRTNFLLVKIANYMGLRVYRRSYILWTSVVVLGGKGE